MPSNFNFMKSILTTFSNLYVSSNTVYSLPICRVHELRKKSQIIVIENDANLNDHIMDLATILSPSDSVLSVLHQDYTEYNNTRRKGQRLFKSFRSYAIYNTTCPSLLQIIKSKCKIIGINNNTINDDLEFLISQTCSALYLKVCFFTVTNTAVTYL